VHRSYVKEVVEKLESTVDTNLFEVKQYGTLTGGFPLMCALSKNWDDKKPNVLVTGGVHGYETSGVQGVLLFLSTAAPQYAESFNLAVCPCVSPWGYERVERWNQFSVDPNRSFGPDPKTHTEESSAVKALLASLEGGEAKWMCHVDCHETTDTDETEYMPARAALAGSV
jgi:predicted deacylase